MNKRVILLAALVLATLYFAAKPSQAQTVVATDPVGFVTTELPAGSFTWFGINLTTPTILTSSNTSLSGDQVGVGIDLSTLDSNSAYCMEVVSGEYEGFCADIGSWNAQTLTLSEDIEAGGIVKTTFDGSRITIRKLPTLPLVFGEDNSAGLLAGTIGSADIIYLYISGSYERFYYFSGGFGQPAGWKDVNGDDASSVTFHHGDGIIIETRGTEPRTISVSGSVKLGPTNIPIYPGFNLLSNPSPIADSRTLSNSGLLDGLTSGTIGSADIIYIPKSGGGFDRYYHFSGGFGQSAEWRNVDTGANADSVLLPNSGAFFVERKGVESSVTIPGDLPNN